MGRQVVNGAAGLGQGCCGAHPAWLSPEQVAWNRQALLPSSFLPNPFRPETTCLMSKESCCFPSPKGILAKRPLWECAYMRRAAISGELQELAGLEATE